MQISLLIVAILINGYRCHLEEETIRPIDLIQKPSNCFHQPAESCPPPGACPCRKLPNSLSAVCCNVNRFRLIEGLACVDIPNSRVKELHVRNANLRFFNVAEFYWRQLVSLSVTDGLIDRVVGEFRSSTSISCLNFSANSIGEFESWALIKLENLTVVDLSHNNLSDVPKFKREDNVTLDMSHNKMLQCLNLYDALQRSELNFLHKEETSCMINSTEFMSLDYLLSLTKHQ